ncbi:MAG: hypothetical protein V4660_10025 [Pseudomonadota bacterium]
MNKMFQTALFCFAFLFAHGFAVAGSADGPYVVWMNLARDPAPVDLRIKTITGDEGCGFKDRNGILFMRIKPEYITKELVERGLVNREPAAIAELNQLLSKPFDLADEGFDGIQVYTDKPTPHIHTLTKGNQRIKSRPININDEGDLESTFCNESPRITRA